MSIYKRGDIYWYKFMWNGTLVLECDFKAGWAQYWAQRDSSTNSSDAGFRGSD